MCLRFHVLRADLCVLRTGSSMPYVQVVDFAVLRASLCYVLDVAVLRASFSMCYVRDFVCVTCQSVLCAACSHECRRFAPSMPRCAW